MKYLFFLLLLIANTCLSQISESEKVPTGTLIGKTANIDLKRYDKNGAHTYMIIFRDEQYQQLDEFEDLTFSGDDATLDALYKEIKNAFTLKEGEAKTMDVGKSHISMFCRKGKRVYVFKGDSNFHVTAPELDRLFGKK